MIDHSNIPVTKTVLIAGATASGKSALALEIARAQGRVIVNADALQVFSNWRVLTARPSSKEEDEVPHALYGHIDGRAEYSVGTWLDEVRPYLRQKTAPVIVGGTGLYFSALTDGLVEVPQTNNAVRRQALSLIEAGKLTEMVRELDDKTREQIDLNNPRRVQRAWEVQKTTNRGLADWQARTPPADLQPHQFVGLHLDAEREWLAKRIEQRFDQMLSLGALEEAEINAQSWEPKAPSSKAIGAKDLVAYIRGKCTLDEARNRAIVATRQYAKRQRTWFRSRMRAWERIALP